MCKLVIKLIFVNKVVFSSELHLICHEPHHSIYHSIIIGSVCVSIKSMYDEVSYISTIKENYDVKS